MNKSLISLLVAAAFALGSGTAIAGDKTPSPAVTPAEQAQMKAEAAAAKTAKSNMTAEEKKAAKAQKQQELAEVLKSCQDDSSHAMNATPSQQAKMKADAEAARAASAKMTPAEKKALSAEKRKMLTECMKEGG